MSKNSKPLCESLDPNESPTAATEQFIKAAKDRNLRPADSIRLIDSERLHDTSAIKKWADARPIILSFFREQLSGGWDE